MFLGKRTPQVFYGSKPKKPKTTVVKPVVIPTQDTASTDAAAQKAEALRRQRGGVASTAMSDVLGG